MSKLCPDCKRPTRGEVGDRCIIRGGDRCIRTERDRLKFELEALTNAAAGALGFLPRNEPGARMAAERIERVLAATPEPPAPVEAALRCECGHLRTAHATHALGVFCAHCECGGYSDPEPASEPRAIVVGSTWRHDISGVEVTVQGVDERSVHIMWLNTSDRRAWPVEAFRNNFTWVSDPPATNKGGEATS